LLWICRAQFGNPQAAICRTLSILGPKSEVESSYLGFGVPIGLTDMNLTALEETVLAYYLCKDAAELNMVGRWWPQIELSSIIEDKVRFAVSRFDAASGGAVDNAARALLEALIERQAFSTSEGKYGPMYQFQPSVYQDWLREAQANSALIAQARTGGPDFWRQTFDSFSGAGR
jgi:hypothetical protein